jgi:uncharacterized protein with ACT and thioredoxin-like domain
LIVIGLRIGKFFWDSRNVSQQKISIMTQNTYVPNGTGNLFIELNKITSHHSLSDFYRINTEELIDKAEVKLRLEKMSGEKIADLGVGEIVSGSLNMNFRHWWKIGLVEILLVG